MVEDFSEEQKNVEFAKILGLEYKPGSFSLESGIKGWERDGPRDEGYFTNRGFGWGQYVTSSRLIAVSKVKTAPDPEEKYEIWVDRFFKSNVGRLTENVRDLIEFTMPRVMNVQRANRKDGSVYYKPLPASLNSWLMDFWNIAIIEGSKTLINRLEEFSSLHGGVDKYLEFIQAEQREAVLANYQPQNKEAMQNAG